MNTDNAHKDCCSHGHSSKPQESSTKSVNQEVSLGYKKEVFQVAGMDCADEISAIDRSLKHPKIENIVCSLMSSNVTVTHHKDLSRKQIQDMIEKAGVRVLEDTQSEKASHVDSKRIYLVAASGITLAVGMLLAWTKFRYDWMAESLFFISVICGGIVIFPKAWRALKKFHLDMNVLMTVAVLGALIIDQHSEAAAVIFLFSLSELLEAFSVARARRAIKEILNLVPPTTLKKSPSTGLFEVVDLQQVIIGDIIQVKPGDHISLDGIVISGISFVNQAALTGESIPIKKTSGDKAYAGTLNQNGVLEIQVTHTFQNTKASQIINLVEEAQKQKAPSQRFVDQFAKYYTPTVFIAAILAALIPPLLFGGEWMTWIYKSLVLLVIACPCALVLSTPVSIVSGLTALTKKGVLVKGGAFLESLGRLRAIALDKTGTLTEGKPSVQFSKILSGFSEKDFLMVATSLEKLSSHPIAEAVVEYANKKNVLPQEVINFNTLTGLGIEGEINGHTYFLSNHTWVHELGICTPELEALLTNLERQAMTTVVVGHKPHSNCSGEVIGVLGLADRIKENSKKSIQALKEVGIEYITVISGDNQSTTEAVGEKVGISHARGHLMPDDKVSEIKKLVSKYKFVGMVGDGINDAPALAQSTVGIAMGAAGTDAAIETADIALMKDDLSQLPVAIRHGRRTRSIIQFNIVISIVAKAVFLVLTMTGHSNLWMAIAADTGVSLLVIFNALRLLKI